MAAPTENYSLIADIGGTNARLQLVKFTRDSKAPTVVKSTFYLTKDFVTFTDCLRDFIKEFDGTEKHPHNATLAVAAAPFNNKLKMVNCHWPEIDGTALGQEFKIQPFTLINDFEAVGYSLLKVGPEHLIQINDVQKIENRTMAVIGSGTGLGECVLQPVKSVVDGSIQYAICPTEGGHKDFAPTEKIDFDYLQFCLELPEIKEIGHFSTEASFCGPAVPNMYKFLCQREGVQPQEISSKDIFQKGVKKEDPICAKVLDLYARFYGKELGNFACDSLPYSGIYLVGGMINSIRDYFTNKDPSSPFLKAYFSKDKVTNNVLGRFPIYIVTYDELGLLGSFVKAQIDAFAGK